MIPRRSEENFVLWQHKQFVAVGVYGRFKKPLEETVSCYKGDIEFAQPKLEVGRKFLVGFNIYPAVDITMVGLPDNAGSIVNYSTNLERTLDFTKDLVRKINFVPSNPTLDFVSTIDAEIDIYESTYRHWEEIEAATGYSIETVFCITAYINFLTTQGMCYERATKKALAKFGIKRNVI